MDEPFGAVDPITRGLLQDELMRLQSDLGKTIVFVTHDFNEAVKLGDRIAVLGDQSHIMQYDTPDAILASPANDMVAGFVGANASLKQLTLTRVRDVPLLDCPTAYAVGSVDELRAAITPRKIKWGLILDARDRPIRWVSSATWLTPPHCRTSVTRSRRSSPPSPRSRMRSRRCSPKAAPRPSSPAGGANTKVSSVSTRW